MPLDPTRHGPAALVTGASSGIGREYARALAARRFDLVITARRRDRLEELRNELTQRHRVRVELIEQELAAPDAGQRIERRVAELGWGIGLLVNNAGFGLYGRLDQTDPARQVAMVDANCRAVLDLTLRFLPPMVRRRRGGLIIVSSVLGFIPTPFYSVYSATKAFDLLLAEALHAEYRDLGIDVLAVCPGMTRTEFNAGAGIKSVGRFNREPEQVVESSLKLLGRRAFMVDGWWNRLLLAALRCVPRRLMVAGSHRIMTRRNPEA
ncbi:MAG TPA: SDR family oxidoreductase [Candidatus Sumerlaeota bacterium]|nr:SDR family oxidoreductase [Candidatus Sumerlaeota bacterium]HOR28881.1 SDR family oxidoreductase [Candidatus Sumerlaeota bacterium]